MSRMQAKTKVIGPYVNINGPGEVGTKIYAPLIQNSNENVACLAQKAEKQPI